MSLVQLLLLPVPPVQLGNIAGHSQQLVLFAKLENIAQLESEIAFFALLGCFPQVLAFQNAWLALLAHSVAVTPGQPAAPLAQWDTGVPLVPSVAQPALLVSS